jgi:hypothetical protein
MTPAPPSPGRLLTRASARLINFAVIIRRRDASRLAFFQRWLEPSLLGECCRDAWTNLLPVERICAKCGKSRAP